jgi:hypothetical protein
MAHEPDRWRWEAGLNLFIGLEGLSLGVLGLSEATAQEKYRLMWPLTVLALLTSVVLIGLFDSFPKKVVDVRYI